MKNIFKDRFKIVEIESTFSLICSVIQTIVLMVLLIICPKISFAVISIGGVEFDDNAFADIVSSSNYAGGFDHYESYVPSGNMTLAESIVGYNLETWIDYDIPPPGMDPATYVKDPSQYVQLGFVDNAIINGDGDDLVIFQQGGNNGVFVSLGNDFLENQSVLTLGTQTGEMMHLCFVDLSDLGVSPGGVVEQISVSTKIEEDGSHHYGVPEIAGAAALNSVSHSNSIPAVLILLLLNKSG